MTINLLTKNIANSTNAMEQNIARFLQKVMFLAANNDITIVDNASGTTATVKKSVCFQTLARTNNIITRSADTIAVAINSDGELDPNGTIVPISRVDIMKFTDSAYINVYASKDYVPFNHRLFKDYNDAPITLNSWFDRSFQPNVNHIDLAKPYMDYTYYLICNGISKSTIIDKTMDDYIKIINSDISSLADDIDRQFWILHNFFAACYHNPAQQQPTCLHIISSAQGIGKTTIFNLFGMLLDGANQRYIKEITQKQYEDVSWGDYKDHTGIIVVNDVKKNNPKAFRELIKDEVDSVLREDINTKGKGITVGKTFRKVYGFTANYPDYIQLEYADRRCHIIIGTNEYKPSKNPKEHALIKKLLSKMKSSIYEKKTVNPYVNEDAFCGMASIYAAMTPSDDIKDARNCETNARASMKANESMIQKFIIAMQKHFHFSSSSGKPFVEDGKTYSNFITIDKAWDLYKEYLEGRMPGSSRGKSEDGFKNSLRDELNNESGYVIKKERRHEYRFVQITDDMLEDNS